MKEVQDKLTKTILEPKKEELINQLRNVVLGKEPSFIPYRANPRYYEIWFEWPFAFSYAIMGDRGFVVDVSQDDDKEKTRRIFELFGIQENQWAISREAEFEFFIDCWKGVEARVGKKIRCFLLEHDLIRGIDVNNGTKIDGNDIEEVLAQENIPFQ